MRRRSIALALLLLVPPLGFGDDVCVDTDADGVCDFLDNCPSVPNPDQADSDPVEGELDGFGDACDDCPGYGTIDTDGDGVCDEADNCDTVPNPDRSDGDSDQIGDACDACPAMPDDPRETMSDRDADGRPDVCDACPDDAADACAAFLGCTDGGALVRVALGAEGASFVGWLGTRCRGLTRDPATGVLHTLSFDPASQSLALYTVDPTTGHATLVAPLDAPVAPSGFGRTADGRLVTISRTGPRPLVAIDPATAAVTVVGTTGQPDHANRGIGDDGGTLLAADAASLIEVNTTTAATTPRAALAFPPHCGGVQDRDIHALLASTNGELYALMRCFHVFYSYLAVIDRQTGVVSFAGNNLPHMTGLVERGTTVPESCTNCVDDDGDGLVDLADPSCCLAPTPLAPVMRRTRLAGKHGLAFDIRADLDTTALEASVPPAAAVALQIDDPATDTHWCARVVDEGFTWLGAGDRLWRHDGDDGLRRLTLAHTPDPRRTRLRARGRRIPLAKGPDLELRIGVQRGAATLPLCFAGPAGGR